MISVSGLKKSYSGNIAVEDLSFEVEEGQVYGLLGPNGAGKSTTMNILTGYISATEGSVKIDGIDMFEEPEKAKAMIGYLPELPPVYPEMTVSEYLKFVCGLKKIPKKEMGATIEHALNVTGTKDVEKRLIRNLSKGYKQRVGLAQALLGSPKVIILDEPTVGLDPKQIIEIRELIKSLGKSHTVILSSHILSEVSEICDHILIINAGKLVASDTPENLAMHLKDKTVLTVTIKGDAQKASDAVREILEVTGVAIQTNPDETADLIIDIKGSNDIREQISLTLAKQGCIILGMKTDSLSLEDIFQELTGSENEKVEEQEQ